MTIKEKIIADYKESIKLKHLKRNNQILKKLVSKIENLNTDEQIFNLLDNLINKLGKKISKSIKRSSLGEYKDYHFEQILYNSYLCMFKFEKKRSIYYEHKIDGAADVEWDRYKEEKPLIFKI